MTQNLFLKATIAISAIVLLISYQNCSGGFRQLAEFESQNQNGGLESGPAENSNPGNVSTPPNLNDGSYQRPSSSDLVAPAGPEVRYVRPDGGTASQCDGKSNAPYPGSGVARSCAWKHPRYALGYGSPAVDRHAELGTANFKVLYLESGDYPVGYGMPDTPQCSSLYPWDCLLGSLPSNFTLQGNCQKPPRLLGRERVSRVVGFSNVSQVNLKCLEITDKASCIEAHMGSSPSPYECEREKYPYGEWSPVGLAASDAMKVNLDYVNIHGLAGRGIYAGRLTDWNIRNSNIDGNGWAGFDGDIEGDDSNSGLIRFYRTTVRWNGCVEKADGTYDGCFAQENGGYGDGLGTGVTLGKWEFDQVIFEANTSDGLDLLYTRPGATVSVKNSYFAHNAGNQLKTGVTAVVSNNVFVGDCSFHKRFSTMKDGDLCRAFGNTLSLGTTAGSTVTVSRNTVTGEGDCLVLSAGVGGELILDSNILDGRTDWRQNFENTCFHYHDGSGLTTQFKNNLVFNVKGGCPANQTCQQPQFENPSFEKFDPALKLGSPGQGLGADLSLVPYR